MAKQNFPFLRIGVVRSANDPPRTNDPFERALFESAGADEVPSQARARVALALGIGVPAGSAPPGTRDGAGGAIDPGSVEAGERSLSLASKAALVGLAGGVTALLILAHPNAVSAPAAAVPLAASEVAPTDDASKPSPSAGERLEPSTPSSKSVPPASAEVAPAPSARRATPSVRRPVPGAGSATARAPAADGESRLLREVARLDQARLALAAADAPLALRHLARYASEFPNGVLAREAARIETRARALESGSRARPDDIGQAR